MNTTTTTTEELTLELRRTYPVSRERLYSAWTDPEEAKHWFGSEGARVREIRMDVRPGGQYHISASCSGAEICSAVGEYLEVTPPSRLVYTWRWLDDPDWEGVDSIVTVEFNEQPGGAEVHLTHRRFPSPEHRARHEQGWSDSLEKLGRQVAR
jgi:uncharacterized protein YndB with AHSA1/START domain